MDADQDQFNVTSDDLKKDDIIEPEILGDDGKGLLDDEEDPYKVDDEEESDETYLNLSVMREMDPYGELSEA